MKKILVGLALAAMLLVGSEAQARGRRVVVRNNVVINNGGGFRNGGFVNSGFHNRAFFGNRVFINNGFGFGTVFTPFSTPVIVANPFFPIVILP